MQPTKLIATSVILFLSSADTPAYTIDLGQVATGPTSQCYSVKGGNYTTNPGTASISAVVQPTPDRADLDLSKLDRCASEIRGNITKDDAASQAEARSILNSCLARSKANYQVQWIIIRRGQVKC
jgi:hypothetical protein